MGQGWSDPRQMSAITEPWFPCLNDIKEDQVMAMSSSQLLGSSVLVSMEEHKRAWAETTCYKGIKSGILPPALKRKSPGEGKGSGHEALSE